MKNENPVGWFEIPVSNIDRAKEFYEKILEKELSLDVVNGSRVAWFPKKIDHEYGAAGTLVEGETYQPSYAGTLVYFSVEDINKTLVKINSFGGKTILPRKNIGEHGFIANFEDSEGNRIALHSLK